jgi:hypothetical protein
MQQQIGLKNERKTVANEYSTKANSQGLSKLSDIHKRNQIQLALQAATSCTITCLMGKPAVIWTSILT